eukprot:2432942-Alexandrium_andersonii.AAC.1
MRCAECDHGASNTQDAPAERSSVLESACGPPASSASRMSQRRKPSWLSRSRPRAGSLGGRALYALATLS